MNCSGPYLEIFIMSVSTLPFISPPKLARLFGERFEQNRLYFAQTVLDQITVGHDVLRPNQVDLSRALGLAALQGHSAIAAVAPSGDGKTIASSQIYRTLVTGGRPLKVLYVTSLKDLVTQGQGDFTKFFPDSNTGLYYSGAKDANNFLFTTYMSLPSFLDRADTIDLIIFDEAHHFLTPHIIGVASQFRNAIWVAQTATPAWSRVRHLAQYFHMAYIMTDKESVAQGNILDFYNPSFPSFTRLAGLDMNPDGEFRLGSLSRRINTLDRNMRIVEYFKQARHYDTGEPLSNIPTFVMCAGVDHANDLSALMRANISASSLGVESVCEPYHSDIEDTVNDAVYNSFKRGGTRALAIIGMLGEGHNNDAIGHIIRARPRRTPVPTYQEGGRARRKGKDPDNPKPRAVITDINDADGEEWGVLSYEQAVLTHLEPLGEQYDPLWEEERARAATGSRLFPRQPKPPVVLPLPDASQNREFNLNDVVWQKKLTEQQALGRERARRELEEETSRIWLKASAIAARYKLFTDSVRPALYGLIPKEDAPGIMVDPLDPSHEWRIREETRGLHVTRFLHLEDLEDFAHYYHLDAPELTAEQVPLFSLESQYHIPNYVTSLARRFVPAGREGFKLDPVTDNEWNMTFAKTSGPDGYGHIRECLAISQSYNFVSAYHLNADEKTKDLLSAREFSRSRNIEAVEEVARVLDRLVPEPLSYGHMVDPKNGLVWRARPARHNRTIIICLAVDDGDEFDKFYPFGYNEETNDWRSNDYLVEKYNIELPTLRAIQGRCTPGVEPEHYSDINNVSWRAAWLHTRLGHRFCLHGEDEERFVAMYGLVPRESIELDNQLLSEQLNKYGLRIEEIADLTNVSEPVIRSLMTNMVVRHKSAPNLSRHHRYPFENWRMAKTYTGLPYDILHPDELAKFTRLFLDRFLIGAPNVYESPVEPVEEKVSPWHSIDRVATECNVPFIQVYFIVRRFVAVPGSVDTFVDPGVDPNEQRQWKARKISERYQGWQLHEKELSNFGLIYFGRSVDPYIPVGKSLADSSFFQSLPGFINAAHLHETRTTRDLALLIHEHDPSRRKARTLSVYHQTRKLAEGRMLVEPPRLARKVPWIAVHALELPEDTYDGVLDQLVLKGSRASWLRGKRRVEVSFNRSSRSIVGNANANPVTPGVAITALNADIPGTTDDAIASTEATSLDSNSSGTENSSIASQNSTTAVIKDEPTGTETDEVDIQTDQASSGEDTGDGNGADASQNDTSEQNGDTTIDPGEADAGAAGSVQDGGEGEQGGNNPDGDPPPNPDEADAGTAGRGQEGGGGEQGGNNPALQNGEVKILSRDEVIAMDSTGLLIGFERLARITDVVEDVLVEATAGRIRHSLRNLSDLSKGSPDVVIYNAIYEMTYLLRIPELYAHYVGENLVTTIESMFENIREPELPTDPRWNRFMENLGHVAKGFGVGSGSREAENAAKKLLRILEAQREETPIAAVVPPLVVQAG